MSVTIMDIIRNADINLQQNNGMMWPIASDQIRNAVILLDKGFGLLDTVDVDALAEKYGNLEDVPEQKE